jgi:hypothetical protein
VNFKTLLKGLRIIVKSSPLFLYCLCFFDTSILKASFSQNLDINPRAYKKLKLTPPPEEDESSFRTVPEEIILHIFSQIKPTDVQTQAAVHQTCHLFKRVMEYKSINYSNAYIFFNGIKQDILQSWKPVVARNNPTEILFQAYDLQQKWYFDLYKCLPDLEDESQACLLLARKLIEDNPLLKHMLGKKKIPKIFTLENWPKIALLRIFFMSECFEWNEYQVNLKLLNSLPFYPNCIELKDPFFLLTSITKLNAHLNDLRQLLVLSDIDKINKYTIFLKEKYLNKGLFSFKTLYNEFQRGVNYVPLCKELITTLFEFRRTKSKQQADSLKALISLYCNILNNFDHYRNHENIAYTLIEIQDIRKIARLFMEFRFLRLYKKTNHILSEILHKNSLLLSSESKEKAEKCYHSALEHFKNGEYKTGYQYFNNAYDLDSKAYSVSVEYCWEALQTLHKATGNRALNSVRAALWQAAILKDPHLTYFPRLSFVYAAIAHFEINNIPKAISYLNLFEITSELQDQLTADEFSQLGLLYLKTEEKVKGFYWSDTALLCKKGGHNLRADHYCLIGQYYLEAGEREKAQQYFSLRSSKE